ncbi:hypothetical protein DL93DRAFT_118578 [Clavulina sp. PMI_390]|nr:hypothetical protein DL93DRAFT_118578 [Clavulina sp. PMI_390]
MPRTKNLFARRNKPPPDQDAQSPSLQSQYSPPVSERKIEGLSSNSGKDLFSQLPTEMLLQIVDELNIESFAKRSTLHSISCLNRRLHAFAHTFLGRIFFIGPRPRFKPAQVGTIIHEQADTLLRDFGRAAYVHHLTIELVSADAALMLKIATILPVMSNLTKLNLHVSQTSLDESGVSHALARVMGNVAHPAPFQLEELECEAGIFNSPPGIYRFLFAQPSIRKLTIRRVPSNTPFWSAPSRAMLDMKHGLFSESTPSLLPSIEEFHGPASYASLMLHGVQHSLKSIMLHTRDIDVDWGSQQPVYTHEQYSSHFRYPSTNSLKPRTTQLARSQSLSIWADQPHPHLTSILSQSYAIAPGSLRFLRFGCPHFHATVELDMDRFPFAILRDLSALEELDWLVLLKGSLNEEPFRALNVPSVRGAAKEFLNSAMQAAASGKLRRIAFFGSRKRRLRLTRVPIEDDGAPHVVGEQEDEQGAAYLELLDGSSWTMAIKTISMEETDFYPLKPGALIGL